MREERVMEGVGWGASRGSLARGEAERSEEPRAGHRVLQLQLAAEQCGPSGNGVWAEAGLISGCGEGRIGGTGETGLSTMGGSQGHQTHSRDNGLFAEAPAVNILTGTWCSTVATGESELSWLTGFYPQFP